VSTVVRPSGPLPARVYWVRRLLLVAIVLALVWTLMRLLGGSDPASGETRSGDPAPQETQSPAPEETRRTPTPRQLRQRRIEARRERLAERRQLKRVQDVSMALSGPTGPCDLTLVQVGAHVPEPAYAGTSVSLRVELRTQQPTACTLELNADHLLVSVVAEESTLWSSEVCPDAVPRQQVVLRPYWTSTVDLQWSGQRSGRRCASTEDYAAPGDYELRLAALTGEPANVAFKLVDPAPVVPVDDEEPPAEGEPEEGQPAEGETDEGQPVEDEPDGDKPVEGEPVDEAGAPGDQGTGTDGDDEGTTEQDGAAADEPGQT